MYKQSTLLRINDLIKQVCALLSVLSCKPNYLQNILTFIVM